MTSYIFLESKGIGGYRILKGHVSNKLHYQVYLRGNKNKEFEPYCGGTLIRFGWVLTSKYCLRKEEDDDWRSKDFTPNQQTVWAGISNLDRKNKGEERKVPADSMILHDSAGQSVGKTLVNSLH